MKQRTHFLRTAFGFLLSLFMLTPFAMIVLNSFKTKKRRQSLDWHFRSSGTSLKTTGR